MITTAVTAEEIESPRTGARLRGVTSDAESAQGALSVLRVFKQDMGRSGAHVHLDFAERFEIVRGVARARLAGDDLLLSAAGDAVLYVPAGVPHINPYNEQREDLVVRQTFSPATEGVQSYLETLAALLVDGRDDNGELPWSLILAVADVTGERSYLTPVVGDSPLATAWSFALQRRVLERVGSAVAATFDYRVHLGPDDPPPTIVDPPPTIADPLADASDQAGRTSGGVAVELMETRRSYRILRPARRILSRWRRRKLTRHDPAHAIDADPSTQRNDAAN